MSRTITYDLGHRHQEVIRLEVTFTADAELVRRVAWSFRPGEAPRRVSHDLTLPAEDFEVDIEVENERGEISLDRRELDGRERGDVVFHIETPETRR